MNIYAIRDRLIDYYMDPFVAPNDHNVKASVSNVVTNPESTNAISQAPHHFEIWRIGKVEEGHVVPDREYIADCSSLVRTRREPPKTGAGPAQKAAPRQQRAPNGAQGQIRTHESPYEDPPPPARDTPRTVQPIADTSNN